jgi:hypothetical protein
LLISFVDLFTGQVKKYALFDNSNRMPTTMLPINFSANRLSFVVSHAQKPKMLLAHIWQIPSENRATNC